MRQGRAGGRRRVGGRSSPVCTVRSREGGKLMTELSFFVREGTEGSETLGPVGRIIGVR